AGTLQVRSPSAQELRGPRRRPRGAVVGVDVADLETAGRCIEGRSRSGASPADDEDVEGVICTGLLQRLECLFAEVGGQLAISHRQICAFSRTFSYGPAGPPSPDRPGAPQSR